MLHGGGEIKGRWCLISLDVPGSIHAAQKYRLACCSPNRPGKTNQI
jgi:hypothetical protein